MPLGGRKEAHFQGYLCEYLWKRSLPDHTRRTHAIFRDLIGVMYDPYEEAALASETAVASEGDVVTKAAGFEEARGSEAAYNEAADVQTADIETAVHEAVCDKETAGEDERMEQGHFMDISGEQNVDLDLDLLYADGTLFDVSDHSYAGWFYFTLRYGCEIC